MLPYTPLHYLLLEPAGDFPSGTAAALVMTSGNLSEEPIATRNDEARQRLGPLADAFLMHDRGIRTRCDDAVVRVFQDQVYPLRRSRGYAPFPVKLPWPAPPLLATGAELKNTFCLTHGHYAFLSHHIGDMENLETLQAFEDGVSHLAGLFRVQPAAVAYDLHPNYLATRYALARGRARRASGGRRPAPSRPYRRRHGRARADRRPAGHRRLLRRHRLRRRWRHLGRRVSDRRLRRLPTPLPPGLHLFAWR
jgi:hydrogenase maturation factor HypF (carbamoyltransferase family)